VYDHHKVAFYHLITVDSTRRSPRDVVGRMYRHLAEARKLAADRPDVRKRIDHLSLYTRYVELYTAHKQAGPDHAAKKRDDFVRFAYRIRKTMMIHSYGIWARTVGQGAAHTKGHPLKDDRPFTEKDMLTVLERGIANNQPDRVEFKAITYSKNLVPAAKRLGLKSGKAGFFPTHAQDRQMYYVWVDRAPADLHIKVTTQHVWNKRPHRISLFPLEGVASGAVDTSDIVRPDGKQYDVILKTTHAGLHRIGIVDGGDYTRIVWPEGMHVVVPSGQDTCHFRGPWSLYFYVPKGTKVVGGWTACRDNWPPQMVGKVLDADGKEVYDFAKVKEGWFSIPVPAGQDGRLWKFERNTGQRQLTTVPPALATAADRMLLPKEVVEADEGK